MKKIHIHDLDFGMSKAKRLKKKMREKESFWYLQNDSCACIKNPKKILLSLKAKKQKLNHDE